MAEQRMKAQYLYKQFQEIPESKFHEFVGPISTANDRKILATWQEHFKGLKIPHIIIERKINHEGRDMIAQFLVTERRV